MKKNILSILSIVVIMLLVSTGCKKKSTDDGKCEKQFEKALQLNTTYNSNKTKPNCDAFKAEATSLLASCADELTQGEIDNIQSKLDELPEGCVIPDIKD